jgi:hypothetical protein
MGTALFAPKSAGAAAGAACCPEAGVATAANVTSKTKCRCTCMSISLRRHRRLLRAASGHAAAAPPRSVTKLRRFTFTPEEPGLGCRIANYLGQVRGIRAYSQPAARWPRRSEPASGPPATVQHDRSDGSFPRKRPSQNRRSSPFRSPVSQLSGRPSPCCCSTRADFRHRRFPIFGHPPAHKSGSRSRAS